MQLFTETGLYQPPAAGDPDHADPNFKPRLRECGKPGCDQPFETTARWRYFCEKCRSGLDIRKHTAAYVFNLSERGDGGTLTEQKRLAEVSPMCYTSSMRFTWGN